MSFKEVTELRKSGQLTQAYNMALADLKQMPNDSWACSALFWVLYDISKQLVEQQRFDNIHNFLQQFNWVFERLRAMGRADEIVLKSINSLKSNIATALLKSGKSIESITEIFSNAGFSAEDIIENIRLNYYYQIFRASTEKTGEIRNIISEYIQLFQDSAPSENHSKILSSILWEYKSDDYNDLKQFTQIFSQWGGIDCFLDSDWLTDDSKNQPLAIKALNRIYAYLAKTDFKEIEQYFYLFKYAYDNKKCDFHLRRKYAILLFKLDRKSEAETIYKQLIHRKPEWYLYVELAEIITDDNLKLSLYSEALLKQRMEEFIGAVHLSLAELFISKNLLQEAATELNLYRITYERNSWKISDKYYQLHQIVASEQASKNNINLYKTYAEKLKDYMPQPKSENNKLNNKHNNNQHTKEFEGELKYKQKDGRAFAFVGDCYISAKLLEQQGITQNCLNAKVQARQLPDGKWQATKILKIEK